MSFDVSSTYQPQSQFISAITKAVKAVVTLTAPHFYTVGEIISFRVSKPYGMVEMNNLEAQVIGITTSTITVPIDTRGFTAFVFPGLNEQTPAMVIPRGSGLVPGSIPVRVNLEDAFDNVPLN